MAIPNRWIITSSLTIKQFIDENKVILHALFIELAKVAPRDGDESVNELEHKGGRGIASGNR